jgi:hypothetical protein
MRFCCCQVSRTYFRSMHRACTKNGVEHLGLVLVESCRHLRQFVQRPSRTSGAAHARVFR